MNCGAAGITPASPCTGSSITAAVRPPISAGDRVEVAEPRLGKSRHLGLEQSCPLRLAGGRHGGERAAVEGVVEGDDLVGPVTMPRAPFARELDRALVRLGAAVAEEHLVEAAVRGEQPRQARRGRVEKRRAAVDQALRLLAERPRESGGQWPRQLTAQPWTKSR